VKITEVILTLNQMAAEGIVQHYAISGAVGATFYLEPVATLDVFVTFRPEPDRLLVTPQPIYDYLRARGCPTEGEYLIIGGWPVQFLPPNGALAEEALDQAVVRDVAGIPARVFRAEHLAAIALQTSRGKDKARLLQFIEAGALDLAQFQAILTRHGLLQRWQDFERQFLAE
jgi:hypothetical protein